MINPFRVIVTPEYLFQPRLILHRFKRLIKKPDKLEQATLPWGAKIFINPHEVIGSIIWCYGIFDLVVAEVLWRLLEKGEVAVDAGANIGQMTSLMSCRTGTTGKVYAFEAHPEVYEKLNSNLMEWQRLPDYAPVKSFNVALTSSDQDVWIHHGVNWEDNQGTARIVSDGTSRGGQTFKMPGVRLDQALESGLTVDVLKMDVEGHEEAVLLGAMNLLEQKRIRDIVFEEHQDFPAPAHKLLLSAGYEIFSLHAATLRPRLRLVDKTSPFHPKEGRDYLATLNSKRALEKLKPFGWKLLCA